MPTLADRMRKAREHAKLSQTQLASKVGVKQQSIQHLENPNKAARGSRYLATIARICGVMPEWLETGKPPMLDPRRVEEPGAEYELLTEEARQVALAWMKLSPDAQGWMRDLMFLLATAERNYPWLRRGRPKGESYDAFERRMEDNFAALKVLGDARNKPG